VLRLDIEQQQAIQDTVVGGVLDVTVPVRVAEDGVGWQQQLSPMAKVVWGRLGMGSQSTVLCQEHSTPAARDRHTGIARRCIQLARTMLKEAELCKDRVTNCTGVADTCWGSYVWLLQVSRCQIEPHEQSRKSVREHAVLQSCYHWLAATAAGTGLGRLCCFFLMCHISSRKLAAVLLSFLFMMLCQSATAGCPAGCQVCQGQQVSP